MAARASRDAASPATASPQERRADQDFRAGGRAAAGVGSATAPRRSDRERIGPLAIQGGRPPSVVIEDFDPTSSGDPDPPEIPTP